MCPHAVVRTQLQISAVGAANKQDLGRCVFRVVSAGREPVLGVIGLGRLADQYPSFRPGGTSALTRGVEYDEGE